MPSFLTEMVLKGFWWAVLANMIVGGASGIIAFIFSRFSKVLGNFFFYAPSTLFIFYIWNVRGHKFWLIMGIVAIVLFVIAIIAAIVKRKATSNTSNMPITEHSLHADVSQIALPIMVDNVMIPEWILLKPVPV
jgi:uncharacterized membrane protein YecN with MAPEG domain